MASEATDSAMNPRTVFLFSGQTVEQKVGGREGTSPEVLQRVVVAEDIVSAAQLLAQKEPAFRTLGVASLADYEDTARRLRDVAEGTSNEWSILIA